MPNHCQSVSFILSIAFILVLTVIQTPQCSRLILYKVATLHYQALWLSNIRNTFNISNGNTF